MVLGIGIRVRIGTSTVVGVYRVTRVVMVMVLSVNGLGVFELSAVMYPFGEPSFGG